MRLWQVYLVLALCCLPSALLEQAIRATNVTRAGPGHRQQAAAPPLPLRTRFSNEPKPAARYRPTSSHNVTSPIANVNSTTVRSPQRVAPRPPSSNNHLHSHNHRQSSSSNRRNHHQEGSATAAATPLVGAYGLTGDQELLCLVRLYVDTYVEHSFLHSGEIDMNDRLVFLVPLVIIYWHHRHHTEPIPFQEIDGVLQEIGDEADIHRRVLREVKDKVAGQAQYCSLRSGSSSNLRSRGSGSSSISSSSSNTTSSASSTTTTNDAQATEALRILRDWIGASERLVEMPAASAEGADGLVGRQSSGVREIRVWFQALASLTRRRPGYTGRARQSPSGGSSSTTPRPPVYLSIAPAATAVSSNRRPTATPAGVFDSSPTSVGTTTTTTATTATEPPFGLPSVSTTPANAGQQQAAGINAAPPPPPPNSSLDDTSHRGVGASSSSSSSNGSNHLINQLKDIQASLQPAVASGGGNSTTAAAQYSEFFELVSSIISEIDQIHNSTAPPTPNAGLLN